jgi:hypothetical protein
MLEPFRIRTGGPCEMVVKVTLVDQEPPEPTETEPEAGSA